MNAGSELSEKSLTPCHVMIASLLAELREERLLNLGLIVTSMEVVGKKLAEYLKKKSGGVLNSDLISLVKLLNKTINLSDDITVYVKDRDLIVKINSESVIFAQRELEDSNYLEFCVFT